MSHFRVPLGCDRRSHPARATRPYLTLSPAARVVYSGQSMSATVLLIARRRTTTPRLAEALAGIRGQPYRLEIASVARRRPRRLKQGRIDADPAGPQPARQPAASRPSCASSRRRRTIPIVVVILGPERRRRRPEAVDRGALDYLATDQVTTQLVDKVLRYATERTHTLMALKASEQRYRELFQNVTAGVFQTTPTASSWRRIRRWCACSATTPRTSCSSSTWRATSTWTRSIARQLGDGDGRRAAKSATPSWCSSARTAAKIVVLENSRAVRDADGRVLFYEGTLTDITAAHELSQQLSYDASHDALTGLVEPSRIRAAAAARDRDDAGDRREARRAATSTSTASRRSTTPAATSPATSCCASSVTYCRQGAFARMSWRASAVTSSCCCCTTAARATRCRSANNLLKAVAAFQFIWGTAHVHARRQHRRRQRHRELPAPRAGHERGRHRLLFRQGRRAQPHRTSSRRTSEVVARRHGEMEWVARAKRALVENRLFLEAQEMPPLGDSPGGRHAHYELLRAHARRDRPRRAARRLPAAVERYNLSVRYDRWVIAAALDWIAKHEQAMTRVSRFFINLSRTPSSIRKPRHSSGRRSPPRAWIRCASASRFPRTSRSRNLARPIS